MVAPAFRLPGHLKPESNCCIRFSNYINICDTENHPLNNLSKTLVNVNKVFKAFAAILVLCLAFAPGSSTILNRMIKDYGLFQTALATVIAFCSIVKLVEMGQKLYKSSWQGVDGKGKPFHSLKDRGLAVAHGVTATSVATIDLLRGVCAIMTLVAAFTAAGGFAFTGADVITGLFPWLTITKNSLKIVEFGIASAGGKAKEGGSPEKSAPGTIALAGVIGISELVLCIFKVASVGMPQVAFLSLTMIAGLGGGFQALKEWSDDTDKARRKERIVNHLGTLNGSLEADERVTERLLRAAREGNDIAEIQRYEERLRNLQELAALRR